MDCSTVLSINNDTHYKFFDYNGYPRNKVFWVYCTKSNVNGGRFTCFNEDEALFMGLDSINRVYRSMESALPTEYHITVLKNICKCMHLHIFSYVFALQKFSRESRKASKKRM